MNWVWALLKLLPSWVMVAAGAGFLGYDFAADRYEKARLKAELAWQQKINTVERRLHEQKFLDDRELARKDDQIKELIDAVTPGECLSSDDVDRLRNVLGR